MTTGIVLHFGDNIPHLASLRIARWLADRYKFPLLSIVYEKMIKDYDFAILVGSPCGFVSPEHRDMVGEICARAGRYIFVQNDYKMGQPGQVYGWMDKLDTPRARALWTTVPALYAAELGKDNPDARFSAYVNWNILTYKPVPPITPKHDDLIYYGAFRPDRVTDFQKFFTGTPMVISAPKRTWPKWYPICDRAEMVGPLTNLIRKLQDFSSTIYMEDNRSHRTYHSPANRFYEALSAGIAQFISEDAAHTLVTADIPEIEEYVVTGAKDLQKALRHSKEYAARQVKIWRKLYELELASQLTPAEKKLGLSGYARQSGKSSA